MCWGLLLLSLNRRVAPLLTSTTLVADRIQCARAGQRECAAGDVHPGGERIGGRHRQRAGAGLRNLAAAVGDAVAERPADAAGRVDRAAAGLLKVMVRADGSKLQLASCNPPPFEHQLTATAEV